jgi:hypothetical protein
MLVGQTACLINCFQPPKSGSVYGFLSALFKLTVASLLAGAALHALDLDAATLLANVGLTPERMAEMLAKGWGWALPNILLGSIVILPAWFIIALLRPPRARD